jgi:cell division protease FtsH
MGVLNTILSRMDGLDQPPGLIGTLRRKLYGWLKLPLPKLNYSILVMAATNRPGVLDAALTRAGRFDEQWRIEPPSEVNLRQVIVYYLAKVEHSESIDVNRLAAVLRGATPAEVRTAIVKKATGKAELDGRDEINESDIYWGALEALIGLDAPTLEPNLGDQKAIAWHEAGHAILLTALFPELKGQLATIVPHTGTGRGGPTLGMVIPGFKEERQSLPTDFLMRRLLMSMAGREATSLLSKGTTRTHMGFGGDRVNMQNALRGLIAEGAFGYSASLLAKSTDPLEGLAKPTNRQVDRLLDYAAATTRRILRDNITALSALANLLLEQGTLTADRLEAFSAEYPIEDISDDVIVGLIEAIEMEEEDVESTVEED